MIISYVCMNTTLQYDYSSVVRHAIMLTKMGQELNVESDDGGLYRGRTAPKTAIVLPIELPRPQVSEN